MGLLSWLLGLSGSDGLSVSQAVVVDSVGEEYAWMQQHFSGFEPILQALQEIDGKPYDVHTLRNEAGEERTVYFDISRFYGKF